MQSPATHCHSAATVDSLLKDFVLSQKKLFALYCVFLLVLPIGEIGIPHLFGRLINSVRTSSSLTDVRHPLGIILSLTALMQVVQILADIVDVRMYPALVRFTRERVMRHLLTADASRQEGGELRLGELSARLLKLPAALQAHLDQLRNSLLPKAVLLAGSVLYFCWTRDIPTALGLMLATGAVVLAARLTVRQCQAVSTRQEKAANDLHEQVDEVLRNTVAVLNHRQTEQELSRLDHKYHAAYQHLCTRSLGCTLTAKCAVLPVVFAFLVWYTWRAHARMRTGDLALGGFMAAFIIVLDACGTLWSFLASAKNHVMRLGVLNDAMQAFLQCTLPLRHTSPSGAHGLRFQAVSYKHPLADTWLLRDLDLLVSPGEVVRVAGTIGTGKSTVLKLAMGYLRPTLGEVYLDGTPYATLGLNRVRERVGYVPQQPVLFDRSVLDNIWYGGPQETRSAVRERVVNLLQELKLGSSLGHLLDMPAGRNGSNLSGGQRQIVWILRVMLQAPDYIVMDEPTSAVDPSTRALLVPLLHRLVLRRGVLLVTHDEDLAATMTTRTVPLQKVAVGLRPKP
jgi:ATP-binding cassette subfamily B protein